MAGAIGNASLSKNGLLTSTQYKWLFPIADKIGTTSTQMVVKAEMSGKMSFICGFMRNYNTAGMLYMSISNYESGLSVYSKWIIKQSGINFFYKGNTSSFELYVSGLQSWAECAFIRLTGAINSVTIVSAVPEDATPIQVSD